MSTRCDGCPWAFSDYSETIQNYGCLPTPRQTVNMREFHGRTWACHEEPAKPCVGTIKQLREEGKEYKVINAELLTERSDWHKFVEQ